MICKNCGSELKNDWAFCRNCGCPIDTEIEITSNDELVSTSQRKTTRKKLVLGLTFLLIAVACCVLAIKLSYDFSPVKEMQQALDSQNAYQVNSLYEQAYDSEAKREKYDELISEFLDSVVGNLNSKDYDDTDLAKNGYTVVYRDLQSDWGDLIYSDGESETIEPSISPYNQSKWEKIQNIVKSRASYCSGVAYLENNKMPQEAIEQFKLVIEEDKYYNNVNEKIAECVDLYVEQTLADAQELIDNDDISGALSKIESINTYLENNGLTSDDVLKKLIEVKNEYAQKYAQKAEICFKERDVNAAIGNIEVAIELAPDNSDYLSKRDTYEMYLPLYLYNEDNILSFSPHSQLRFYDENEVIEAVNGEFYAGCINYRYFSGTKSGIVKYILDGKYDTVTGTFLSPKVNAQANRTGFCYFVVYGDGKELYKSETINAESKPIQFSFNVKDIQNLEIEFIGNNSSVYGVGTYSNGDYAAISELTAQKDFSE